jgi:hypothetical protein
LLRLVDYFLPNNDEALLLTGLAHPPDQLRAFMQMGPTLYLSRLARSAYWQAVGVKAGSRFIPVSLVDPPAVVMLLLPGWC